VKAVTLHGPFDVRCSTVPDPAVLAPTDAVVRVVAACVCGSDLWPYRGDAEAGVEWRMGHEFVGVVEEVGSAVAAVSAGDFVISPFSWSDGTCAMCRRGVTTSCLGGGWWGGRDREGRPVDGGQGEYVRVPQADGTLVPVPDGRAAATEELLPSLLTLSDVMCTGHHAAVSARVTPGCTVAVVGDGAVGLCGVLAARRLGAERIVAMSRYPDRQAIAVDFGATDVVGARGADGAREVGELLSGGADAVLECVGTGESMRQALAAARPGGTVGFVGIPHDVELPVSDMFQRNVGVAGGVAPARIYLPELLDDVLARRIAPGRVFDRELPLGDAPEAYDAMHSRKAVKVLLRP